MKTKTGTVLTDWLEVLFGLDGDGSRAQCRRIMEDTTKGSGQKATEIGRLLMTADAEDIESVVKAAIIKDPEIAMTLAGVFARVFTDTFTTSELESQAFRVHKVLFGFVRAELGVDIDRARPGFTVPPYTLLGLAYMGGVPVPAMNEALSGQFAHPLAHYFSLTVACDTEYRAEFMGATAACLCEAEQIFTTAPRVSGLFQQVAWGIEQKSQRLYAPCRESLRHLMHGAHQGLMRHAIGLKLDPHRLGSLYALAGEATRV